MQKFYDDNESTLGGVKPSVEGALKTIAENMQWQTEHKTDVVNYFKTKSNAALAVLSPLLILLATFVTKLFNWMI